jgi:hypothetical protein
MKPINRLAAAALILAVLPTSAKSQQQQQPSSPRPTNVRLTFHLIEADGFQGDDAEIRPIVTELRRIFRFQGYRLVSKSVLAGTAWPGSRVSQQIAADGQERVFSIDAELAGDGMGLVRLTVSLDSRFVTSDNGVRSVQSGRLISASVNLQDGKTVVLGSSRQTGESAAIILAVTPTITS